MNSIPAVEPKTKVIAQVTFDEDKLREIVHEAVERIKEEYDIVDNPDAVSEWIPCSERLPSEYGNYLITMGDGAVDVGTYGTPPIDGWSACDANGFYRLEDEEVIAWMPLPEPWKGADDDL